MSQATPALSAQPHLNRAALTMFVAAFLTAFGPFWYLVRTPRLDGVLATILLVLPSVLVVFSAIRLLTIHQQPELLTLGTAAFDVAKNLLVAAYVYLRTGGSPFFQELLAYVSLVIACALVVLTYGMTSWIMNTQTDGWEPPVRLSQWQRGVIMQLLQHRFLSICGLLIAYLHLLLFLSLAIAFHDLAVGGGSIERQVRRPDLPGVTQAQVLTAKPEQPSAGRIRTFAFPIGSTSLRCTAAASKQKLHPEFYAERHSNVWRMEQLQFGDAPVEKECGGEVRETAWNLLELQGLKDDLSRLYDSGPFERYRIAIVSHASDHKVNSGFSSNYEMSRARAEQVQAMIETLLSKLRDEDLSRPPLNVEWQVMPSGTGDMYLSIVSSPDARRLSDAGLSRALTTEVQLTQIPEHLTKLQRESLEPRKGRGGASELQLLDYVYFMTTIAAANDLAPASGFVQFVSAAGHISQLFLLVVAFNVILAFRRPRLKAPDADAERK